MFHTAASDLHHETQSPFSFYSNLKQTHMFNFTFIVPDAITATHKMWGYVNLDTRGRGCCGDV